MDVHTHISTPIDPRYNEVRRPVAEEIGDPKGHTIGRGTVDGESALAYLPHPERTIQGQGMGNRRLLTFRRHHPKFAEVLEGVQQSRDALGRKSIVVGDENAG